ncbi:hypothetical protein Tco_0892987 [Tanacetum coccineum]|uniref:Uncharacterized protein n=1 Tax=Tanacetum coccineum TaxID=301880 RepID=A0ABQ5C7G7_9ASTR
MLTLVFVDLEISTQVDGAQSPGVSVPFPKDPYEDIRQAYLVETDTESEPFKDPVETETPETARMAVRVPPVMSPGLSASIAEVAAISDSTFLEDEEEEDDEAVEESSDSDSESEDVEDEGPAAGDEGPATGDKGHAAGTRAPQRASPVVETAMGEPLGLGYEALRRREIASREGQMPNVFEVGQGSGSVPDPE